MSGHPHPWIGSLFAIALTAIVGCPSLLCPTETESMDDGPVAKDIMARLGEPLPSATAEQRATFERGRAVLQHRFSLGEGLGPAFNVTFCGGCHEKPVPGGSAGLYRNFFLAGRTTSDGAFVFSASNGEAGGVLRMFNMQQGEPQRPAVPETTTIFAQRNPIPFFGMGLIAELSEEEILSRADPDDADGDGISGKPNFDRGFVGRFGRKSQTVSLEGFIRGPLFNHLGVTTVPLTDEQRAQLPVDSSAEAAAAKVRFDPDHLAQLKLDPHMQAAAPDAPNFDDDAAPDPEMTDQELFDLVSFQMLMAAPQFETPSEQSNRGRLLFHDVGCSKCHVPRLQGPRGPIPAYSDLLLHDMGPALDDGIVMKDATGSEFRTQPLWGLAATAPYLHDGRAGTIAEAILWHGGEAQAARDAFAALSESQQGDVVEFLMTLGGRDQASAGLLPPDAEMPAAGEYGGPVSPMSPEDLARFERGRALFDRDFSFTEGTGGLHANTDTGRFNGDSCRACHLDPVIGGAGPRGVNVMRHGILNGDLSFSAPATTPNTILHKEIRIGHAIVAAESGATIFETRQTPHVFGAGLVESIPDEAILANADEGDVDVDGIRGRANKLADGRIGRFGWKADVPSVAEFVRDAMAAEIGLTVEAQAGLTFGMTKDDDGVADPELTAAEAEDLAFFIAMLAPPPRQTGDAAAIAAGEVVFEAVGCAKCHVPVLSGALGDAHLFSDLLLHDILPAGTPGIESADAKMTEFRTAPLWGLSQTAPYFHDGRADTIDEAIRAHAGEADAVRAAYEALGEAERGALIAFLGSL